ncbi:MAG: ATP-binding protein [Verrucomicrobiia bacterium]
MNLNDPGPLVTAKKTATLIGELRAYDVMLDAEVEGRIVAELFHHNQELPGVILRMHDSDVPYVGLSQREFLRQMTRPFGPEVFGRRPARLLVEESGSRLLSLPPDMDIESATAACLRRDATNLYEPVLIDYGMEGARLLDFQTLLISLSRLAELRARQMETILETVPSGLLLLDKSLRVLPGYSRSVESMLGVRDFKDHLFAEVLGACLDRESHRKADDYLKVLVNPGLIDHLIQSINPLQRVSIRQLGAEGETLDRHLAFRFQRIRQAGKIRQILVTIEDRTREVELQRESEVAAERAEQRLRVLTQLAGADTQHLPPFLSGFQLFLHQAEQAIEDGTWGESNVSLRRRCHALKGEAATLGLSVFRSALHSLEDQLVRREGSRTYLEPLQALNEIARDLLKLGRRFAQSMQMEQMDELAPDLAALSNAARDSDIVEPEERLHQAFQKMLARVVQDTAERWGKEVKIVFDGAFQSLQEGHFSVLREVCQQLCRNAVIHGIEPPDVRLKAGKHPVGVIQVGLRTHDGLIEVIVQDDGAGLDERKLREKAGFSPEDPHAPDARELIFDVGISTASEVTEDAGRGIGLDQVQTTVAEAGGTISTHYEPGRFCAFQIVLPIESPAHEIVNC